jgi:Holliday junction resolvasome RuvABC endonuclease subunit
MPFPDSQGTTFTFNGNEFSCTNIKKAVSGSSGTDKIDVSTLKLPSGAKREYQDPPLLDDPNKGVLAVISVSFLGLEEPATDKAYAIACNTLGITGKARCTKYEVEAAVGEVLKGTAEFAVDAPETP